MPATKTERAIDMAAAITALNGIVVALVSLTAIGGATIHPAAGGWGIIAAAIQLGLAYGIYRASRICASAALAFFVFALCVSAGQWSSDISAILVIVWGVLLIRGTIAIFKYHKHKMSQDKQDARPDNDESTSPPQD